MTKIHGFNCLVCLNSVRYNHISNIKKVNLKSNKFNKLSKQVKIED